MYINVRKKSQVEEATKGLGKGVCVCMCVIWGAGASVSSINYDMSIDLKEIGSEQCRYQNRMFKVEEVATGGKNAHYVVLITNNSKNLFLFTKVKDVSIMRALTF